MVLLASDYDKSKFLNADDLGGGERKFRIKAVTEEEVGKEKKLVVWFTNDDKGLVLNKTNNRVLRAAFGDNTTGWARQIIIMFSMMVPMQGKMVAGLRVRIPPPKQAGVGTTRTMTAGKEYDGSGPVATKPSAPAKSKPPAQDDELDGMIESQPPPKSVGDELDDEIDF